MRQPDEEAFAAFVRARSGALLSTAWALTRDKQLAEDLVQTALARCYAAWPRIESDDPEAYVRRTMLNAQRNVWRRRLPVLVWPGELPEPTLARPFDDVVLTPFSGIAFLWFIGVLRDGLGRYEDKFFSTVFIGSGLLFLAMMFVAAGVGAGIERSHAAADPHVATFGQMVLLTVSKTYALRMAAVFMISLATIWLKTGLMPRWLVGVSYLAAVGLLVASDVTMWLVLAFPVWVLVVSLLLLARAGVIDLDRDDSVDHPQSL